MQDFRPTILHHVLQLAPFEGWSEHTLREAGKQAGVSEADVVRLFSGGISDCMDYYFEQLSDEVNRACPKEMLATKRVPERIELLIMTRLQLMQPHKEAVKRATSSRLLPWKATGSIESLFTLTDDMWKQAGDNAVDFNFYTKRLTLAAVYTPVFWFWLNDSSQDLAATRQFLQNRLADVAKIGKKKKALMDAFTRVTRYARK